MEITQTGGRTVEKANVLVQYPNYRNRLTFGAQITEYGFTEITERACTTLMQCCCMASLLKKLLMKEILLMLSDANPHQDYSFQAFCTHSETQPTWISFYPHHHPEEYFVQLHVQLEVTSEQKICGSGGNEKSWTEPMNWQVQTHSELKIKRSVKE